MQGNSVIEINVQIRFCELWQQHERLSINSVHHLTGMNLDPSSELMGTISKYIGCYGENKAKNLIKYLNQEQSACEMQTRGDIDAQLNFLDIQKMFTLIHSLVGRPLQGKF